MSRLKKPMGYGMRVIRKLWSDTGRRDMLIPADYKCHGANKPTLARFLIGQPNPKANTADK